MSIRFPSDDNPGMSNPDAPSKRGGGRFLFMLIFGVVAFMVIRSMTPSGPTLPMEDDATGYRDLQTPSTQQVDTSDWFKKEQRDTASQKPQSSSNSGFGMEDVTTTRNERTTNRVSQPSTSSSSASTAKQPVRNGDWSLDSNIDTTPKSSAPKKTTKGDWGMEQVE